MVCSISKQLLFPHQWQQKHKATFCYSHLEMLVEFYHGESTQEARSVTGPSTRVITQPCPHRDKLHFLPEEFSLVRPVGKANGEPVLESSSFPTSAPAEPPALPIAPPLSSLLSPCLSNKSFFLKCTCSDRTSGVQSQSTNAMRKHADYLKKYRGGNWIERV